MDKEVEEAAVDNIAAVRGAVGDRVDILIEVHRRLSPMNAVRVAKQVERFRPFWYEEPVPSENLKALAEVRSEIGIPVVTGEALYGKAAFREVFEARAADIINPDVANCGGILELKEIAAMAEPHYVAVSPHNYNSTSVALASTVQVSACIPNFLITEYFVNFAEKANDITVDPIKVKDGYIELPTAPGLGIELDEGKLEAEEYFRPPARALRTFDQEGP